MNRKEKADLLKLSKAIDEGNKILWRCLFKADFPDRSKE